MAFNPFSAFRKYRKPMFAVVTILTMFIFILSSGLPGGADLLDRIMGRGSQAEGGKGTGGVATIGDHKVTQQEFVEIGNQRRLANTYLALVINAARETQLEQMEKDVGSLEPSNHADILKRYLGPLDKLPINERIIQY